MWHHIKHWYQHINVGTTILDVRCTTSNILCITSNTSCATTNGSCITNADCTTLELHNKFYHVEPLDYHNVSDGENDACNNE